MSTIRYTMLAALLTVSGVACASSGEEVRSKPASNDVTTTAGGQEQTGDAVSDAPTGEDETTTTSEPKAVEPAPAQASDFVGGNVDPAFAPGAPGELVVVAVGAPDGEATSIPFVVRNNTNDTLYDIGATGKVTADGKLVGSGEDQGVEPAIVEPGEIAFGYIYFTTTPPAGATVEISATAETERSDIFASVPMAIGEANLVPGDFGSSIVGEVTAPDDVEVETPVNVMVLCVDAAGTLSATYMGYVDGENSVQPGAAATYSVDIYSDAGCPTFLVGSSGYEAS